MDQSHREARPGAMEVTLRWFELADVDAMMAWVSDPQVAALCRWDAYESMKPLLSFIRDVVVPYPWFHAFCLVDGDGETGRPVDAVFVTPAAGDPYRVELGYVLVHTHWGRGVTTAAVKRAVATVLLGGGEVEWLECVEALVKAGLACCVDLI